MTAITTTTAQRVSRTDCPRCDPQAYDVDCDEYEAQPCCRYVTGVDQLTEPDEHYETCVNAPAWMTDDNWGNG